MSPTVGQISEALRSGAITTVSLAESAIRNAEILNRDLDAFVVVDAEGALEAAKSADEDLAAGHDRGPLTGVPVAVKDIVDIAGHPTRCGSAAYSTVPVSRDATLVTRLREGGAIIIGKTTAHELACGVYSAPASNPWDLTRIPGGSSGGSGAAVAAGIVPVAIGSDTGGSIRIPASLCGVVGLKPTYGRVSRVGVEPLAWSLDHLGPLAATVEGCVAMLEVICGDDEDDPSTRGLPPMDLRSTMEDGVEGLRIGVLDGAPLEPMQPAVRNTFRSVAEHLRTLGADLVEVEIPELAHTLAAEFGIVGPEAAAYHKDRLRDHPDLIDPGIRALLVAGLVLPAHHYVRALQARGAISEALRKTFSGYRLDGLLSPTLPATAAEKNQEEIDYGTATEPVTLSYVRTTAPFNLSGLPTISVPAGFDGEGLPIGVQFAGRPYDEAMVARVGYAIETLGLVSGQRPQVHSERRAI